MAAPLGGPGSLDGIWSNVNFTDVRAGSTQDGPRVFRTADREPVPMLPWAAKVVAGRLANGGYENDSTQRCVHQGMPYGISTSAESPIEIVETPDQKQVTVLYEQFTTFRIINMDQDHPAHPKPSLMGDAVGHWEGDTLVVDTIAVSDKTTIMGFIPHSDQMHLLERMRRTGADTMEDRLTIDDPKTFSRPWAMLARFKRVPGIRMAEFLCENNRFRSK